MMKKLKIMLLCCLAVVMAFGAGCSRDDAETASSAAAGSSKETAAAVKQADSAKKAETKAAAEGIKTKVYFADANGEKLIPVIVTITGDDKYSAAVEKLISGIPPEGAFAVFPKGVKVNSIKVNDGVAVVDFSAELIKNFQGGSAGELMLTASLADTLTEFAEVEKVKITVDGFAIDTISGHLDFGEPFSRDEAIIKK
jgi:spore germination protein GerM